MVARPLNVKERKEIMEHLTDGMEPVGDLWNAIQKLPAVYKDVILLKYYCQMDNAAVARVCGITESSVRSRLFRVRKKLKRFETAYFDYNEGEAYEATI